MFKNHRTKILSWPQEEVLEVYVDEPNLQQIVGLETMEIKGRVHNIYYGCVVDYDGVVYDFEWDDSTQRLSRLVGSQVNGLIWGLSNSLLKEHFSNSEIIVEQVVEPTIDDSTKELLETVREGFKHLTNKVEALQKTSVVVESPKPVVKVETPKPQERQQVQKAVELEPPINNSIQDEDISQYALQFLEETDGSALEVDYLSLQERT